MASELAGSAILEAVKHRANHKPIIFCSLSLIAIGILMTIFGVVVLILDHSELGPPVYDSQYERYAGSSLAHILGPMFIGFGGLTIVGNFFMLAYASRAHYMSERKRRTTTTEMTAMTRQTTDGKRRQANKQYQSYRNLQQHHNTGINLI